MKKLIIIDGNAIIHRAYHAIPPLTTQGGLMVNAVYGFASMLLKVWRDLKPDYIAVTFDMAGGTFRHEQYKEYKAKRVKADQALYDQIPLVHQLVESFNIPIYEQKGYEADDVIATIVSQIINPKSKFLNLEAYIVTGDMDTLQLVSDNVKVYTLRKGLSDIVIYDPAAVQERYGFPPERMVDYKALRGDASDNIPGVPGIGEKTATELIQKIGSFHEIYTQIRNQKSEIRNQFSPGVIKKLEAGEESGQMSYELATAHSSVPNVHFSLDDAKVKNVDKEKVLALFQKLEFASLLKRVPGFENSEGTKNLPTGQAGKEQGTNEKKQKIKSTKQKISFIEVKSSDEVKNIIELVKKTKRFACRMLTTGADVFSSSLTGMVLVVEKQGFYIKKELLESVWEIFSYPDVELVGHDVKQVVKIVGCHSDRPRARVASRGGAEESLDIRERDSSTSLRSARNDSDGMTQNHLFDIMIASYLLSPGSRAHDLFSIALKTIGKEISSASGQDSLFGVDPRLVAEELAATLQIANVLQPELEKANNFGLFQTIEMPLIPVLGEMELNGIAVDTKKLSELSARVKDLLDTVTKKIYGHAGQEFNISSPIQLREILFEKLEIPVDGIKKGKTGLSTSAEQLEKMRGLHPIIDEIEKYRELTKLQNTYIDVLPALINKKTNRIHTTFNQAVAATGRLSSSDPNLQNIPIRTELGREIREAFVAEKGNVLISADYSQIELRIVASLAEDKKMMEIFEKGEDIHQATAAAINNVPLEKVTKDMRRAAKEINFGILYGMGTYGLSWRADIPAWQAKAFIEKYFSEFSGVKKYLDRTLEFTRKEGYCETLFGRRRYIPELTSSNYQLRSAGERMAINHPIQGTAADLMKMAMIKVDDEIKKKGNKEIVIPSEAKRSRGIPLAVFDDGDIKMILQVHDELVFEVKKGTEKEIGKVIKETMESVTKLRVPIEVHVSAGHSWGKMEKI